MYKAALNKDRQEGVRDPDGGFYLGNILKMDLDGTELLFGGGLTSLWPDIFNAQFRGEAIIEPIFGRPLAQCLLSYGSRKILSVGNKSGKAASGKRTRKESTKRSPEMPYRR